MNINKFTNDIDNPFHSNGYAQAARGNEIGSTSPQSFNQRLHIEKNRTAVRKYRDSMLVHGHHREKHNFRMNALQRPDSSNVESAAPHAAARVQPLRSSRPLISDVITPATRPRFSEPPTRSYNPYK